MDREEKLPIETVGFGIYKIFEQLTVSEGKCEGVHFGSCILDLSAELLSVVIE